MRHIIVIGGSAGAITPMQQLLRSLPAELSAAVFVVIHTRTASVSQLASVLQRGTRLRVAQAIDGERIAAGQVYVARPDYHLLLESEVIMVSRGPRENRNRPAIDPLFRSAAYAHGSAVTGVVLSGCLDDGTAGSWAVKQRGGRVLVQLPAEAEFPSMPESVLEHVTADGVLPVEDIARTLIAITQAPLAHEEGAMNHDKSEPKKEEIERSITAGSYPLEAGVLELGPATRFTCPECGGVLGRIDEGAVVRFRCHTGHAYSVRTLLDESMQQGEQSLYRAMRAREEALLLLTTVLTSGAGPREAELQRKKARLEAQIETLRRLLEEEALELTG